MKILYVTDSIAETAGMSRILVDKMNWLAEQPNYDVHLCVSNQGNHPYAFQLSPLVTVHSLNVLAQRQYRYRVPIRYLYKFYYHRLFVHRLQQLVDNCQPDMIVGNLYYEPKAICSLHTKASKVIESHCALSFTGVNDGVKRSSLLDLFNKKAYERQIDYIKKHADKIVCLTHGDRREWNCDHKVAVIPNTTKFLPPHSYNIDSKTVIAAGRLVYQKGLDLLINAWHKVALTHSDWKLMIYGDGGDRDKLLAMIKDYHLDEKVCLCPSTDSIHEIFANSSFYVLSSRYEGFGLVLIEAMMAGIPCVSFDCPYGPSDIIQDGSDGLLVENGNTDLLAKKICWMIEHPEERARMANEAYRSVQRFSVASVMPYWVSFFNNLN